VSDNADPIVENGHVNARYLLDTAIEEADQESEDGLFYVNVPAFKHKLIMRRLNFDEVTAVRQGAQDAKEAQRRMVQLSIVEPPFSKGEVDEIMTNGKLFRTALIINAAVNRINHLTDEEQAMIDANFRVGK
jgi:hypothetical protein